MNTKGYIFDLIVQLILVGALLYVSSTTLEKEKVTSGIAFELDSKIYKCKKQEL